MTQKREQQEVQPTAKSKQEEQPLTTLRYLGSTTPAELFGGSIPLRDSLDNMPFNRKWGHKDMGVRDLYQHVGELSLRIFSIINRSGETELVINGPPLTGYELNGVMLFAAPDKAFGLDTADILNDWQSLYSDPKNKARLNSHSGIPNWNFFANKRELLYRVIQQDYENYTSSTEKGFPQEVVTPVIWLTKDLSEQYRWRLDDLDRELAGDILSQSSYEIQDSAERLLPVLGPVFAAAYSPDITDRQWPSLLGYPDTRGQHPEAGYVPRQSMGSTQVIPLSLVPKYANSLFESDFMGRLIARIDTLLDK